MFGKHFERIVNFRVFGPLDVNMVEKVQKGIHAARFYKPQLISVEINSSKGSFSQATTLVNIFKNYSDQTGAPVYCFADFSVYGNALLLLCSGNKCYANKLSSFGDFGYMLTSFGLKSFAENWEFERKFIHSGKNKVKLNQFEDLKAEDVAWVENILHAREQEFKQKILQYRKFQFQDKKITPEILDQEIWNKRIFSGTHAYQMGLIDGLESLDSVIEERYHDAQIFQAIKPVLLYQQVAQSY